MCYCFVYVKRSFYQMQKTNIIGHYYLYYLYQTCSQKNSTFYLKTLIKCIICTLKSQLALVKEEGTNGANF